ncbi:MAG: DUF1015 domain-containing protein [Clostridiaceae bacterium]|nr:DUF1015 domain-containing protein [Clostridiaceae bacterium]
MAIIRPFKAIRPQAKYASEVAALPYDVMNREEAFQEIQDKPYSFLRIDRAETTLSPNISTYDDRVYQKARENLETLIQDKIYLQDPKPSLYLYQLTMDERNQTGLVCCASVDEYLNNNIKKHEKTREDKEIDRIKHVDSLNANTGPIFLAYRQKEKIAELTASIKEQSPEINFIADDGIKHAVWIIEDEDMIEALISEFSELEALYIADGHHRCASAVRVAQMRREEFPDYNGDEEFNYFLSVLFPDEELKIYDYNRLIKDLNGLTEKELLEKINEKFEIRKLGKEIYKPQVKAEFAMYLSGDWYQIKAKKDSYDSDDIIASLDVSILQNNLLNPILGIEDPRTDNRIDFVGGIRGLGELKRRVDNGEMQIAFALYPTSISELFAVADANLLMPPKSTWFEPKLRSGLFIHSLSD